MPKLFLAAILAGLLITDSFVVADEMFDDARVITNDRLDRLSFLARQKKGKVLFKTEELLYRLMMVPPTDSILITKASQGQSDTVWYTDPATTQPTAMTVTREEHQLLSQVASGIWSSVFGMKSGPVTTTELVKTQGPDGAVVMVPVKKTTTVVPSQQKLTEAIVSLSSIENKQVREAAEFLVGTKLAELYPTDAKFVMPERAAPLLAQYRKLMMDEAVEVYAKKRQDELPPVNEPILFGWRDLNAWTVARAVNGATPTESFETEDARYAGVWEGSNLILMRIPKTGKFTMSDIKLQLNQNWRPLPEPQLVDDFRAYLTPGLKFTTPKQEP